MSTSPLLVQKKATFSGHRDCVYTLERSSERNHFYSAGGDGVVAKWDINNPDNGELVVRVPNSIYAIKKIEGHEHLLIGQNFEGLHLIDLATKTEIRSLKITNSQIFDIQTSDKYIFAACGDGEVVVLELNTFKIITKIKHSDKSARTIAVNPLVNEFVVGYSDYYIRVFSLEDFSLQKEWKAHNNSVFSLNFSPDYKFLLSGSRDAHLKIWNPWNHYESVSDIAAHMYAINHAVFAPDGVHFASGSMDKSVKLWDTAEWKLLKVLDKSRHAGHATSVNKLLWLDSKTLVSTGDDKLIHLWEF